MEKGKLDTSRISLVFFVVAIAMSFQFTGKFSADQGARNQAKLHESQLEALEAPNHLIQEQDVDSLQDMNHAIKDALDKMS